MDIVQELIDIHEGLQRLTAQTIKIVEIVIGAGTANPSEIGT